MSREARLYFASISCALLLQLMPLPISISPLKPWFLGLVCAYFALEQPQRVGLGSAFFLGLTADLLNGVLIGEQAFRLTILVYILLRFRYRLRFFPLWQQTAAMSAIFLNDRVLTLWVRLLSDFGGPPLSFWLSPLSAALLWPWLFLLLDRLRLFARIRHEA